MSNRKDDHINLALQSATPSEVIDRRFDYNPISGVHPELGDKWPIQWGKYSFDYPIWVSSMTGGAGQAAVINANLARLCQDFGLGMGLGSCRKVIDNPETISDFQIRKHIGDKPLFANLGIAQCQQWLSNGKSEHIKEIINITEADGLIIHVNPLQEWMQPEGDRFEESALVTIKRVLDKFEFSIIVKEVGQGMSKDTLYELMQLPLEAIEFGAFGGTNFALLEMLRESADQQKQFASLCNVGHTAEQMVNAINELFIENNNLNHNKFIISGGIKNFLDAYYHISKLNAHSIVGMASTLLNPARESYESLKLFFTNEMQGLLMAKSFLKVK